MKKLSIVAGVGCLVLAAAFGPDLAKKYFAERDFEKLQQDCKKVADSLFELHVKNDPYTATQAHERDYQGCMKQSLEGLAEVHRLEESRN